ELAGPLRDLEQPRQHRARNLSAWVSPGAGARWPRSARVRCCRPFVSPGTVVYGIKNGHHGLLGRPPGEAQRIEDVLLGALGVLFRVFDIELMTFAVDAVMQLPRSRGGVGLY